MQPEDAWPTGQGRLDEHPFLAAIGAAAGLGRVVKTVVRTSFAISIRPSVPMPVDIEQVAFFDPYQGGSGTDAKLSSCADSTALGSESASEGFQRQGRPAPVRFTSRWAGRVKQRRSRETATGRRRLTDTGGSSPSCPRKSPIGGTSALSLASRALLGHICRRLDDSHPPLNPALRALMGRGGRTGKEAKCASLTKTPKRKRYPSVSTFGAETESGSTCAPTSDGRVASAAGN
jgi:hypothetical protein